MREIIGHLLERRGIPPEEAGAFLDPSLKRLADADALPGISAAADVILGFARNRRKIIVFGDYDCDGVCSLAILSTVLERIGADVSVFVPDRFTEGYGLTVPAMERMLSENPSAALVVTVDCGISSAREITMLKERGIDTVVTDHHVPPQELPECLALVDPKLPEQHDDALRAGADGLCGAGVAFFLACSLARKAEKAGIYSGGKFAAPLLVLAGLASVVDIVPLLGQNRILAAAAIRNFPNCAPVGLKELFMRSQKRSKDITSRDFGFQLGPRINAAGRMASAAEAYRLLVETDREKARELAFRVDMLNADRKSVENRMAETAVAQTGGNPGGDAISVFGKSGGGEPWHAGVCGIVASRLVKKYERPASVAVDGHGSVRAPEGYDMHAALSACAEVLERFGGHALAGGFTVKPGMEESFRSMFADACAAQNPGRCGSGPYGAFCEPEMWLEPGDLTLGLRDAVKALEPFGEGNPEPVFGLKSVVFSSVRLMGENGRHAAFEFADRRIPRATWWGMGETAERLRADSSGRFDIAFTLDESDWGGEERHPELRICAARPESAG